MDLSRFGQEFRGLREGRGLTRDKLLDRTGAYKDAKSLYLIENGENRPKRAIIIRLLVTGLEINETSAVDHFLKLAGYDRLLDKEVARLGLRKGSDRTGRDKQPKPPDVRYRTIGWQAAGVLCCIAALALAPVLGDIRIVAATAVYACLFG